ncbi:S26 family signal peptidase [Lacibacter sp. H407]|uniref:S26 family signal peptidase n=1 Tax=Lacibacter sp. H407 TaxID=3133423 RepID=UPI0030C42C29
MSTNEILWIFIINLLLVVLPAIGLYGMFKKAGVPAWKAVIPFYNVWVMVELAGMKRYWFFLQFIPIVGWFITVAILIDFVKTFGKFAFWEHALTVLVPFIYFTYIGFNKTDKYLGADSVIRHKKSAVREWVDAAIFAIVAAGLIRMFLFEAYVIPTPSMERSLLVNDFLFVSKTAYGSRVPNTPLAFPLVHHTFPVTKTKSYLEWIKLDYRRWFAKPVKRNDVVVFNLPVGDTVINDEENFGSKVTYYEAIRQFGGDRQRVWDNYGDIIITRPVDKRENFIKRCVGIAGDTLEIKNGVIFINGKIGDIPPAAETNYVLKTKGQPLDYATLEESYGIRSEAGEVRDIGNNLYEIFLTKEQVAIFSKLSFVESITPVNYTYERDTRGIGGVDVFPNDTIYTKWTIDNYGPLYIPKKGTTIQLTPELYSRYERVIRTYEGNDFEMKDGKFFVNGQATDRYTFKLDYFWLMGDNRHNSLDSRYWGFVPEDHVVGKASLIFFSWNKGPRWNRIFRSIK